MTPLLVKTLDRPSTLARLLSSVRKYYPQTPILVADDSREKEEARFACAEYKADFLELEEDVGLSAGRNALFAEAQRRGWGTAMLLDDDFVFIDQTRIERLAQYVRHGVAHIAAGTVLQQGRMSHYEGLLERNGNSLVMRRVRSMGGPVIVDIAYNFFAACVETVCRIGWDARLKVCEHQAFFLRCQEQGIKVIYDPAVVVDHWPERNPAYSRSRVARANEYFSLMKKLYGLDSIVSQL